MMRLSGVIAALTSHIRFDRYISRMINLVEKLCCIVIKDIIVVKLQENDWRDTSPWLVRMIGENDW